MHSRFLIFTATSVVVIAILTLDTSSSTTIPKQQNDQAEVINRTRLFEVLKIDRVNERLSLTLKNNYDQAITAFVVSLGKNYQVEEEFAFAETFGDFGIQSGETYEKRLILPESSRTDAALPIAIEAVVLADGLGDGSPLVYEHIVEERVGRAVQIRRSLRLLDQYLKTNGTRLGIDDLTSNITTALDVPEEKTISDLHEFIPLGSINPRSSSLLSDHVNRGLKNGQEDILRLLAQAKSSQTPRESLLRMKTLYERFIARL
jgi:hypothetical protein